MISVITNDGKFELLSVQQAYLGSLVCCLYTNAGVVWGPTTSIADLTEAVFTGYARQALTPWTDPIITDDDHALSQCPAAVFHNGGITTVTVVGYFLFDVVNDVVVGGGAFDVAQPIVNGGNFLVSPSMSDTSEF